MILIFFLLFYTSVSKQASDFCRKDSSRLSECNDFDGHWSADVFENGRELNKFSDKTSVSGMEKGTDMALVVYNEESVLPLYKAERVFNFVGRNIKIKQNWTRLGVAAVVWDAVSTKAILP